MLDSKYIFSVQIQVLNIFFVYFKLVNLFHVFEMNRASFLKGKGNENQHRRFWNWFFTSLFNMFWKVQYHNILH